MRKIIFFVLFLLSQTTFSQKEKVLKFNTYEFNLEDAETSGAIISLYYGGKNQIKIIFNGGMLLFDIIDKAIGNKNTLDEYWSFDIGLDGNKIGYLDYSIKKKRATLKINGEEYFKYEFSYKENSDSIETLFYSFIESEKSKYKKNNAMVVFFKKDNKLGVNILFEDINHVYNYYHEILNIENGKDEKGVKYRLYNVGTSEFKTIKIYRYETGDIYIKKPGNRFIKLAI